VTLTNRNAVVAHLGRACDLLGEAHAAAGETEGDRVDLTGSVRDAIYGLNTAIDALAHLVIEGEEPSLGLATTRQLLEELAARFELLGETHEEADALGAVRACLDWLPERVLAYRTVDDLA